MLTALIIAVAIFYTIGIAAATRSLAPLVLLGLAVWLLIR